MNPIILPIIVNTSVKNLEVPVPPKTHKKIILKKTTVITMVSNAVIIFLSFSGLLFFLILVSETMEAFSVKPDVSLHE